MILLLFFSFFRGEWTTSTGRILPVAAKVLKKETLNQPGAFEDFVKEVQSMHALDHENLIRLYGIVLTQPMMMIVELAPLGKYMSEIKGPIIYFFDVRSFRQDINRVLFPLVGALMEHFL